MALDHNKEVFLTLVQAGLWEKKLSHPQSKKVDFSLVCQLAEEHFVIGLVAAGIEQLKDVRIPQSFVFQIIGETVQIEQRNIAMNDFINTVVKKMQETGLISLLVKGQGVAQCYERPLWRPAGDIDFLLDNKDYKESINLLLPFARASKYGGKYSKEVAFTIHQWMVELHGTMRTCLSTKLDKMIDNVQSEMFSNKKSRVWINGDTNVLLPSPDDDVFLIFTHFIKHFYKEGMSLRQICDWCRLIWAFRADLDLQILESRINRAGLMIEWKVFAALAVDYLGMPADAMPMYETRFKTKEAQLIGYLLKGQPYNILRDTWSIFKIFPVNTIKFLPGILFNICGLKIKERLNWQTTYVT